MQPLSCNVGKLGGVVYKPLIPSNRFDGGDFRWVNMSKLTLSDAVGCCRLFCQTHYESQKLLSSARPAAAVTEH